MAASAPFDLDTIGTGLAFAGSAPQLRAALQTAGAGPAAVVEAPPGSGKTTLVPPLLAGHLRVDGDAPGRVLVTQPRRVAVRAAARRLAALDRVPLGRRVGYAVRGDRRTGPDVLVEFCTPGLLLRRLLAEPDLPGVAGVILDEVHERDLDTDLLLGLLTEVRELRGDLALVAMSATIDAPRFARLLGDAGAPAPIITSPAAQHPLRIDYAPSAVPRLSERGVEPSFLDHVAATAAEAFWVERDAGVDGDALVFLPGAWEVARVAERLRALTSGVDVLELHSQRPAAEQDAAVAGRAGGDRPRIVVSTSLAESSLTVPGVRLVVDAGLTREPRRDAARDMSGLVTVSASRAAMDQRAGRAARLGPGRAVRCLDERTHAAAPAEPRSQLSTADLTGAALTLAAWGAPAGEGLRLPEPPPERAMADAHAVLLRLGAVDETGRITAFGRRLAGAPADPRLARGLLAGAQLGSTRTVPEPARLAAEITAVLAGDQRATDADLPGLWRRLRAGDHPGASAWRREADRFERIARADAGAPGTTASTPASAGMIVALAHPDRVARLVTTPNTYLLASGTRASLPPRSPLAGEPWLAVAEATRAAGRSAADTGALIRAAAPISVEEALSGAETLRTSSETVTLDDGRLTARTTAMLGAIELTSTAIRPSRAGARATIIDALRERGLAVLELPPAAEHLRRRLAFLHHHLGEPWPAVDAAGLAATADTWLEPWLARLAGGLPLRRVDGEAALRALLPWPDARRFDELAPERLTVPSGSRIRLDYPDDTLDPDARPVIAVKLQECFGLTQTPTIAGGRVRLLFHLLSPAGRPVGVTDDLAGFWAGPYAQVRAENRGRYPKHPWPEDPSIHRPTRLTKRRL